MSPPDPSPPSPIPPETRATLSFPPIPTPTFGTGGHFTVGCSSVVEAAPLICLEVVLNSTKYPEWNRFCRKCTIDSQPPPDAPSTPGLPDRGPTYLKLGTKFTFDVHMHPTDSPKSTGRATALEVSVLEQFDDALEQQQEDADEPPTTAAAPIPPRSGWRVAWKTRPSWLLPGWMLRSERVQEFVHDEVPFGPRDEPQTRYTCWETFYGVLAPVVKMTVGKELATGFNVWAEDMKRRAEEVESTEGAFAPASSSS